MRYLTDVENAGLDSDGTRYPIRDAFFSPRNWSVTYLVVDIGGWLGHELVLVHTAKVTLDHEGSPRASLSDADLQAAPHWSAGDDWMSHIHVEDLPPIIVGPFGSTYSPSLMAAQFGHVEDPEAKRRLQKLERAGDWIDRPAFGPEGELGPVVDLGIGQFWSVDAIVIRQGGALSGNLLEADPSHLRIIPDQGTHLVFDLHKGESGD